MIIRCWGEVNGTAVEFHPVPDRPDYWEGLAPRQPGLQDIEIWAESDSGARGHLQCSVQIQYYAETCARLLLIPYFAQLINAFDIRTLPGKYIAGYHGCRRCQNG